MQRRFRRSRRGVLEGLPLTLIISVIIAVIGTAILFGLFYFSQSSHLANVSVFEGPAHDSVSGWIPLWTSPLQLQVVASSQTHGALGGVLVSVNGSGVDVIGTTASNGTVVFSLPVPALPEHSTDGSLTITATYNPPPTLGASSPETSTVSEVIIG